MTPADVRPRVGDRLLGFLGVRLVIWILAVQAFLPGVLSDPRFDIGHYHDEHGAVMEEETARRTIVQYHQVPAWDPWYCGGIPLTSTSNAFAPDFLFRILFGTGPGRRVTALFFALLGMEGTFRYARKNGASAIGGALAGVAFACSGDYRGLLALGWLFMFAFNLVPWTALAFEEGLRKRWWLVAGGFFLAWMLVGGGTYALPYTGLVLGLLTVHETVRALRRADGERSVRWYRPALCLLSMAVLAGLLSAIRFIPLMDVLATHTREVDQKDLTQPASLLAMVALGHEHAHWAGGAGDFYVGGYVVLLALVAALSGERRAVKFWVLALVFGVLACGEFIDGAPYQLLRKLPVFSQLRFPVRMTILVALFVALAASLGVTRVEDALRRGLERAWSFLSALAARLRERASERARERTPASTPLAVRLLAGVVASGVVAYGAWQAGADVIEHDHVLPKTVFVMGPPLEYHDEFRQARGNRWDAHVWPFASRGTIQCFFEQKLFESPALRGDRPAEEFGAPGTGTHVERVSWSPNVIVLRVRSSTPGHVIVNQNFSRHWRADLGEVYSDDGLLAVRHVPPGEHILTLRFSDWHMRLGALVTITTLLAIAMRLARLGASKLRSFARAYRELT
jgi:hypothetical protein